MKALILAAGEGKRMLPLTANLPKCLLKVGQYTLLEHHILRLKKYGIVEIVINVARHAELIQQTIGDGSRYGVTIGYSCEGNTPLETGGGVLKALPLLGVDPFISVNADVYSDYPLDHLLHALKPNDLIHLVLIKTPAYRSHGDFCLTADRLTSAPPLHTYSGLGVFKAELFQHCAAEYQAGDAFALLAIFLKAIAAQKASAELYEGLWIDVGTPDRLAMVNELIMK